MKKIMFLAFCLLVSSIGFSQVRPGAVKVDTKTGSKNGNKLPRANNIIAYGSANGGATIGSSLGYGGGVSATIAFNKLSWNYQYAGGGEINIFPQRGRYKTNQFMVGRLMHLGRNGYLNISSGISHRKETLAVSQDENDNTSRLDEEIINSFGIPLSTELFYTPYSWIALGVSGYIDVNNTKKFAGANLTVKVGKF